ncbi:hypothetical protein DFH07DRAFT_790835 [Mycena maculata]|uniref:Uncharacterized protein n=1 Tax=Mycena maculata TaxID=230809 RepID=A0AAD7KG13_9AGAR|nr:hypothetical protein DFH07DRAFT_790835 [Mycena maculata]
MKGANTEEQASDARHPRHPQDRRPPRHFRAPQAQIQRTQTQRTQRTPRSGKNATLRKRKRTEPRRRQKTRHLGGHLPRHVTSRGSGSRAAEGSGSREVKEVKRVGLHTTSGPPYVNDVGRNRDAPAVPGKREGKEEGKGPRYVNTTMDGRARVPSERFPRERNRTLVRDWVADRDTRSEDMGVAAGTRGCEDADAGKGNAKRESKKENNKNKER